MNQYPNNGFYGQQNGYAFGVARPQPMNTQPLTQEMVNQLRQDGSNLNMKVDQKDLWRAICTHKDPATGASTLSQNVEDGTYSCSICGARFHFFEGSRADVEKKTEEIIDIMQTIKAIYMDAPIAMTEQYNQQIALLRKLPELWTHACNNMEKYAGYANPIAPVNNYYNGFNALNNLLTNPYGYQQPMMGQQPMYGQPMMQQPVMGQQPMYGQPMGQPMAQQPMYGQPMYGQPMMQQPVMGDPNVNPMAYGTPNMAPSAGVMPQAPAAPTAAPAAAPAASNEIQQQKVYNV